MSSMLYSIYNELDNSSMLYGIYNELDNNNHILL